MSGDWFDTLVKVGAGVVFAKLLDWWNHRTQRKWRREDERDKRRLEYRREALQACGEFYSCVCDAHTIVQDLMNLSWHTTSGEQWDHLWGQADSSVQRAANLAKGLGFHLGTDSEIAVSARLLAASVRIMQWETMGRPATRTERISQYRENEAHFSVKLSDFEAWVDRYRRDDEVATADEARKEEAARTAGDAAQLDAPQIRERVPQERGETRLVD